MSIVINKAAVRRALEAWCIASRSGQTISIRETAKMSAVEVAGSSSDYLYQLLCDDEDSQQFEPPVEVEPQIGQVTFELDFTQAEQLLGQYSGDTDAKFLIGRNEAGKLTAWRSGQPPEEAVVLAPFEADEFFG